jgi:uncharacterized membrane protein (DUF2068 family)
MSLSPTTTHTPAPGQGRTQAGEGGLSDHHRGLLLSGLFKLSKALGCILVGAAALNLVHRDLGSLAMHLIDWLGIDPTGRFAALLLDKADLINAHDLRVTGAVSFVGAALYATEGTGLMLRKVWAEYFTVVMTGLGLPFEIYEMFRHFTMLKLGLFVTNLVVVGYLIWLLRRKRESESGVSAS